MSSSKTYIEILNEGVNFRRIGEFEKAKEKYLDAIKMEPKKSVAYFNLGKILYILKDYEASVNAFKVAFELGELQDVAINVFEHMGHALLDKKNKNGKYKKVIYDYSRALKSISGFYPTASIILSKEYKIMCIKAAKSYLGV